MYGPAPPRPKKTNIVRSRKGCYQCRVRRKKCDEIKPSCGLCVKQGQPCEPYAPKWDFRQVDFSHTQTLRQAAPTEPCVGSAKQTAALSHGLHIPRPYDVAVVGPLQQTREDGSLHQPGDSGATFEESLHPEHGGDGDAHSSLENDSMVCRVHFLESVTVRNQPQNLRERQTTTVPCIKLSDVEQKVALQARSAEFAVQSPGQAEFRRFCPFSRFDTLPETQAANAESFYLTAWETCCIPALPRAFQEFWGPGTLPLMAARSMMALSACQISRGPSPRFMRDGNASSRPDIRHLTIAIDYYRSAMRIMRGRCWNHPCLDPTLALAVMLNFCNLESIMGNFQAFELHSAGIEQFLTARVARTNSSSQIRGTLIAAWLQARLHTWWLRLHFSTPNFHRDESPIIIHPAIASMLPLASRRATVLHVLCESYRLQFSTIARFWQRSGVGRYETTDSIEWRSGDIGSLLNQLFETQSDELSERLSIQKRLLRDWHTQRTRAGLPISDFGTVDDGVEPWDPAFKVLPLKFHTHQAAMNYAYYAAAQMMQSTGVFASFSRVSPSLPESATHECNVSGNYWILLLLRITAGINWQDCIRFNMHTIGLSGLLLACAIQSNELAPGVWIQKWLEFQSVTESCEEGSFPVIQILKAVRLINSERCSGRDVVSIYHPHDDEGGTGKYNSYNSQTLESALVFGKCRRTGLLYSRFVKF